MIARGPSGAFPGRAAALGRAMGRRAAWLALVLSWSGCSEESTFTIGRDPLVCEASIPTACETTARCTLDTSHYIQGRFPGSERFIVRTDGAAKLNFEVLLLNQKTPGSEFILTVHEPNCSDRYTYDSGGRDLYRLADVNGVLQIPMSVARAGDHFVELVSDAFCDYALKYDPG